MGFQDEVWWSRVTQPNLHAWADADAPLLLVAQTAAKDDPDRKALACYGLLVSCPAAPDTLSEQVWLRFVEERPVQACHDAAPGWCCDKLAKLLKGVVDDLEQCLVAYQSRGAQLAARAQPDRQGARHGRSHRRWRPAQQKPVALDRIELHWMHGKRKVVEPARLLTAKELAERVCAHFGCEHEDHLAVTEKAT